MILDDYPLHNWEYDISLLGHVCAKMPPGGVPSKWRCRGCGVFIPDRLLVTVYPLGKICTEKLPILNWLAWRGLATNRGGNIITEVEA